MNRFFRACFCFFVPALHFPTEKLQEAIEDLFFRKYKEFITGVTFWNVSDRRSWLDNFPVRGRKNYLLLFDKKFEPQKSLLGRGEFLKMYEG